MLAPKKQKFRKAHKGRVAPKAKAGTMLNFGMFGLKSVEQLRVTARQIEAATYPKIISTKFVSLDHNE